MIRAPHILLLGASGQNQGKSTLACHLIGRQAKAGPVVGAKITTIRERGGECPRGGEGCGVCGSLEGDWDLSEELGENPGKDTGRMLAAGAEQVFWLRVCQGHLEEGVRALLHLVGDRPLVCEGNSPRLVLEPSLFLVARDRSNLVAKPSAAAVREHADETFVFDGAGFEPSPDRILWSGERWTFRREATAVIMAGGASRRMGRDKSLIEVDGQPLIAHIAARLRPHFDEILVSSNDPDKYSFLHLPVVADTHPGQGPLRGIASALDAARHSRVFVTATDIPHPDPFLVASLLRRQRGHLAAVPRYPSGYLEPLFAVYDKGFGAVANQVLAEGERAVRATFDRCSVAFLDLEEEGEPTNLNTPEDLRRFRARGQ